MTELLDIDREGLFQEIVEQGREEGIVDEEAYHELIEDVVQEHVRVGEADKDSSTVGWVEHLKARWNDYREELGLNRDKPLL